mmetsp:Transcript_60482/g.124459  ORF Transcript_60482/g.124459 Transcript_60482/m.124459 type:complete len:227 (+) Transcript_60482:1372-2052(+)
MINSASACSSSTPATTTATETTPGASGGSVTVAAVPCKSEYSTCTIGTDSPSTSTVSDPAFCPGGTSVSCTVSTSPPASNAEAGRRLAMRGEGAVTAAENPTTTSLRENPAGGVRGLSVPWSVPEEEKGGKRTRIAMLLPVLDAICRRARSEGDAKATPETLRSKSSTPRFAGGLRMTTTSVHTDTRHGPSSSNTSPSDGSAMYCKYARRLPEHLVDTNAAPPSPC